MKDKSILIFGAGKIGRSFIGQIFGLSGYEVVFSDVDQSLVDALNERKSYPVVIKGENEETLVVPNVRAVSGLITEQVVKEVSQASVLAVSVGKNAIEKVVPLIGEGLKLRYQNDPTLPLDIIIAENMRSASDFIRNNMLKILHEGYPFDKLVGLVETSIGKMVPIMTREDMKNDPLIVFAEPYNNLIVDKKGFRGEIPEVKDLSPKENIKAWVDRKLFIHNLGHATAAYFGAYKHPEAVYIYEVLNDPEVFSFTRETMLQSSVILQTIYPGDFSMNDLELHIDDLLYRFQNKALKDTIFRVGQDRIRKLGSDDRFMGIIRLAEKTGKPYNEILKSMTCAFFFHATGEDGNKPTPDLLFDNYLSCGVEFALQEACKLDLIKDKKVVAEFLKFYKAFDQGYSIL